VARALAEEAVELVGGELVGDDESLWADHRERAAGLHLTRCLPADAPATIERLRAAGATTIVGRYARGLLLSDVEDRGQAPEGRGLAPASRLERRVVEAYGG
jgi:hypothetical protein